MSNDFAFDNNQDQGGSHISDWGFTNNSNPAAMTCKQVRAWNNTNSNGGDFQSIYRSESSHRLGHVGESGGGQTQPGRKPAGYKPRSEMKTGALSFEAHLR